MHLQNQLIVVFQSWGKFSTSSLATALEMLAMEVTPGLLAEAEPDTHQLLYHNFIIGGGRMEIDPGKQH
jgi:hypothetical protein